jgi:hypothetical protein
MITPQHNDIITAAAITSDPVYDWEVMNRIEEDLGKNEISPKFS